MAWALVKDGAIINLIAWDGIAPYQADDGAAVVDVPAGSEIGWVLRDGQWVDPTPPAPPAPPAAIVVDAWRFWAVVSLQSGLSDKINAAIAGLTDPVQKVVAQAKLDHSPQYNEADPLFTALGAAVGLTADQIHALFVDAAALS